MGRYCILSCIYPRRTTTRSLLLHPTKIPTLTSIRFPYPKVSSNKSSWCQHSMLGHSSLRHSCRPHCKTNDSRPRPPWGLRICNHPSIDYDNFSLVQTQRSSPSFRTLVLRHGIRSNYWRCHFLRCAATQGRYGRMENHVPLHWYRELYGRRRSMVAPRNTRRSDLPHLSRKGSNRAATPRRSCRCWDQETSSPVYLRDVS
jgi:hypothetical protein